jgi:predicted RNase H-like HicB family nuclease
MAIFIAMVRRDSDSGFTASFPDFPGCSASAPTVDRLLAKAKESLSLHIERLLEANQGICVPTVADAIDPGDALLLAAVEVPDDFRTVHVDLAISALSLARIDSFARRHGLTHSALFVEAINRWAMQEAVPTERRAGVEQGPTFFDFIHPPELRVETVAAGIFSQGEPRSRESETDREHNIETNSNDVTAELVRLFEESPDPQPPEEPENGCTL